VYIPSYDDLTPSIPDIDLKDVFQGVARLQRAGHPPAASSQEIASAATDAAFACLRGDGPGTDFDEIAREFSPRIQRHANGCVVLDVSGLGRLIGDAAAIQRELERAVADRGLAASVAVASTQTSAMLRTFGTSLAALQQFLGPGADPKPFDILRRWGLTAIAELASLPPGDLAARLGQHGVRLQQLARGIDPRPLVPDPGVRRFVDTMELEWPIEELEPLSFVFARLLDTLAVALEQADRGAAAMHLDLRLVNRTHHARTLQLPAAMRDPRVLRTLLLLDLESHPPPAAIDIVTIEIDPAPARIVQYSLLERARPSDETLATLNARLNALVGDTRVGSPVLLDTHRPDAFEMRRFDGARPRLTVTPPSTATFALRRFRPPIAIRVALEHGRPAHIPIDRQRMPGGRVVDAAGPWRTSGEWWGHAPSARWNRDEWDVALADGSICRIFFDRDSNRWFMDGVVD
jgi:protein ImuB